MPFFRLGKIDRGDKGDKEKRDSPERGDAAVGNSAVGGAAASASKAEDKPEKKKKQKDGELGAVPASGGESRNPALSSSASTGVAARAQAGLSVNDFISKTKNQQRQGLKPSGPELIAYARYLGIDPVADHDLLWIATEALEAPLPSDWTEHFDSNDRVFYYNATMRVSSWTHPLEHIYRETYKTIVNFRNANMSSQERNEKLHALQLEVKQMEHDVHKEIAQWTEHTDESGNRFYFNREERQSTWTDPRPAKCQILYLRIKMLRLLQSSSGGTPGFADSKGEGLSRFVPLSSSEFDDPASKRPKVVGNTQLGGGNWNAQGSASNWAEGESSGPEATRASGSDDSPPSTDSDSEDDRRRKSKKKKKKKKKKNKRERLEQQAPPTSDERHAAAPPPGPGAGNLRNSQSEPTVGGKPLLANVDEVRNGLGLQPSPSGPQSLALSALGHDGEGLNSVGRARVKAGIRLEPISIGGPGAGSDAPPGGSNSAWVPR